MWTIYDIKQGGKFAMKRNYWKAVLAALVLGISTSTYGNVTARFRSTVNDFQDSTADLEETFHFLGSWMSSYWPVFATLLTAGTLVGLLITFFLFCPVNVGCERYFIINRVQDASLAEMGHVFSNGYLNVVKTMFLRSLFTFLWMLLFIIPGIIKAYEYRMIPYILAENPNMDTEEAFRLSREMMAGEKWNTFVYDLSYIGWYILSAFTAGILAVFYVAPYKACADAELYAYLRDRLFGTPSYR